MRALSIIIAVTILVLAVSGAAFAAELFSAPMLGANHVCLVANVGDKDVVAYIEFCYVEGCKTILKQLLLPGAIGLSDWPSTATTAGYCKFTIDRNPRDVRATACVTDGKNPFACVTAE